MEQYPNWYFWAHARKANKADRSSRKRQNTPKHCSSSSPIRLSCEYWQYAPVVTAQWCQDTPPLPLVFGQSLIASSIEGPTARIAIGTMTHLFEATPTLYPEFVGPIILTAKMQPTWHNNRIQGQTYPSTFWQQHWSSETVPEDPHPQKSCWPSPSIPHMLYSNHRWPCLRHRPAPWTSAIPRISALLSYCRI